MSELQLPPIYVSKFNRIRKTNYPRCDNLRCSERTGGMGPGSHGVVCHPPIFYWEGVVRDSETKHECKANIVLCCFCAEQSVGEDGNFSLYLVDNG